MGSGIPILSVLCGQEEFLRRIVAYQFGIPGDLLDRFRERFLFKRKRANSSLWVAPSNFRRLSCSSGTNQVCMKQLYLSQECFDRRFAFHLAIAENEIGIVNRIMQMDPILVTIDAFFCALRHNRAELVDLLFPVAQREIDWKKHKFKLCSMKWPEMKYKIPTLEVLHRRKLPLEAIMVKLEPCLEIDGAEYLYDLLYRTTEKVQEKLFYCNAVYNGNARLLRTLLERYTKLHEESWPSKVIGKHNNLELIQVYLEAFGAAEALDILHSAAVNGHRCIMDWIYCEYGVSGSLETWREVVKQGLHSDVVQWLVSKYPDDIVNLHFLEIVRVEDIEIIRALDGIGQPLNRVCPLSGPVADYLIERNIKHQEDHVNMLFGNDLYSHNIWSKRTCEARLQVVRKIYAAGGSSLFRQSHANAAAKFGGLEVVRFLYEQSGVSCSASAINDAVENGDVKMVEYLHEVAGLEWSFSALEVAFGESHVDVLMYCKPSESEVERLFKQQESNLMLLEWLIQNYPGLKNLAFCVSVTLNVVENVFSFVHSPEGLTIHSVRKAITSACCLGSIHILEDLWGLLDAFPEGEQAKQDLAPSLKRLIRRGQIASPFPRQILPTFEISSSIDDLDDDV